MRVLILTLALLCALFTGAAAQQTSNDKPKEKKTRSTEPAEKKPAEKTPEASPAEEQKSPAPKPGTDKDKEDI